MFSNSKVLTTAGAAVLLAAMGLGQSLPPDVKAKMESKAKQLQAWSVDPQIVAAVKAHNASESPEEKAMSNEKWKGLTLLDPFVRSYTKNSLGQYLKSKKEPEMAEVFVSGADGTKVAFLSKTTNWSHKGKEKHQAPMAGRIFYGPIEVDESTGLQCIQIGLPVLDGGKPVGSIVIGFAVSKL